MQKILFPILSSILTFASFLPVAFAQTLNNNANNSIHKSVKGKLTERQWRELNKRYYQSRYLNQFTSKNSFSTLWEVKEILENGGRRRQVNKQNIYQHWYCQYSLNLQKK